MAADFLGTFFLTFLTVFFCLHLPALRTPAQYGHLIITDSLLCPLGEESPYMDTFYDPLRVHIKVFFFHDISHRVQRRCVCRWNIKTRRKLLKKWVILIALQFRYIFYRPQTKRLRARKIGLLYKRRSPFGRGAVCQRGYALRLLIFKSRSGSDKKRRNRLQQIYKDPTGLINPAKRQVQTFFKASLQISNSFIHTKLLWTLCIILIEINKFE